jgi:hypothetical protein
MGRDDGFTAVPFHGRTPPLPNQYDYLDDGTLVVFLSADDPEAEIKVLLFQR